MYWYWYQHCRAVPVRFLDGYQILATSWQGFVADIKRPVTSRDFVLLFYFFIESVFSGVFLVFVRMCIENVVWRRDQKSCTVSLTTKQFLRQYCLKDESFKCGYLLCLTSFVYIYINLSQSLSVYFPISSQAWVVFRSEIVEWLCFTSVLSYRTCGLTESSSPRLPSY